jgi:hypothetical protein
LQVDAAELERRRAEWIPPKPHYTRGFGALYPKHVTQANEGCDFNFLEAGEETPDPAIHYQAVANGAVAKSSRARPRTWPS